LDVQNNNQSASGNFPTASRNYAISGNSSVVVYESQDTDLVSGLSNKTSDAD
jgi:hypothetical protein